MLVTSPIYTTKITNDIDSSHSARAKNLQCKVNMSRKCMHQNKPALFLRSACLHPTSLAKTSFDILKVAKNSSSLKYCSLRVMSTPRGRVHALSVSCASVNTNACESPADVNGEAAAANAIVTDADDGNCDVINADNEGTVGHSDIDPTITSARGTEAEA